MPFAPASRRGAFFKARLAGKGIQWPAGGCGTLNLGAAVVFVQHGDLFAVSGGFVGAQTISFMPRRKRQSIAIFAAWLSGLCTASELSAQIRGCDPEYLAFGLLGVEPEQRQLRKGLFQPLSS